MQFTPKGAAARVATRYIPQGAIEQAYADADAVVYLSSTGKGQPCAIGYVGTAGRPAFHHLFNSSESRDKFLTHWLAGQRATLERKVQRLAERKNAVHDLVEGDIVYSCWGYEQTNIDFYQVVRVVSPKTVQVRQVAQQTEETGFMSGKTTPIKDAFIEDAPAMARRAEGSRVCKVDRDHGASTWDGRPVSCSWGH
jgi:hypothetical protein